METKVHWSPEDLAYLSHEYYFEYRTLAELGREYGVTRERIRQVLGRECPHDEWKSQREELHAERVLIAKMDARSNTILRNAQDCAVCGTLVMRLNTGKSKAQCGTYHHTCSHECAEAWRDLRYVLCKGCHKRHMDQCERVYRADPTKYAKQLQAMNSPNRGHYEQSVLRGSRTHEAMIKYRPDLLEIIPFSDEVNREQWTRAGQKAQGRLLEPV